MNSASIQLDHALNRATRAASTSPGRKSAGSLSPAGSALSILSGPMLDAARFTGGGRGFAAQFNALRPASKAESAALPISSDLLDSLTRNVGLRPFSQAENVPGVKGAPRPLAPLFPAVAALQAMSEDDSVPGSKSTAQTEEQKVQATARKWLAQTFYGTMLKQMRNSPFKSELFSGGRGGKAFEPLLDQHLADHMARTTDNRLAKAIARKLMARKAGTEARRHEGTKGEKSSEFRALSSESGAQSTIPNQSAIGNPQSAIPYVSPGLRA